MILTREKEGEHAKDEKPPIQENLQQKTQKCEERSDQAYQKIRT